MLKAILPMLLAVQQPACMLVKPTNSTSPFLNDTLTDSHQPNLSSATMMQSTADQIVGIGSSLPKRKASYVNIETLVNSQYNIDMQRLKDELRTLKAHDTEVAATAAAAAAPQAAAVSAVGSSEETKENKEPSMRSSCSHSSLSLAKYHHQSRLQPPRDGFNLCV
jgi:hypothetical protein